MSAIQDSFEQLLHMINNGNDNEILKFHYLMERNSIDESANDCGDFILHIAAERDMVTILCGDRSDISDHDDTNRSVIELTQKNPEFLQRVNALIAASRRSCKVDVLHLFMEIIHRECGNNSQMTAEKLISLQYRLWQAVELGNAEVIEHMIVRGCSVDDCHPVNKFTALCKAVKNSNLEIVRVLIKYGADVDFADEYGTLPIAYCDSWYSTSKQQPEIMQILLDKSKQLRVIPQESFIQQIKGLLKYGNKRVIQMVIECRPDVFDIKDDQGMTILHYLVENRYSDIFELLHGRKINLNVSSTFGYTPLYMAAAKPHSHINTFKFLLENGADINARSSSRCCPLFALCRNHPWDHDEERYVKITKVFLKSDVDIQFVGSDNTTVFDVINTSKSFYMAELLIAHLVIVEEQGNPIKELIRDKINSSQMFKDYFKLCKDEIVNIKNNSKDQGLTLYTILVNSEEKIFNIHKSHVNSLSKLQTLTTKCTSDHAYYGTIKKRICTIGKSIELYRNAAPAICQLTKLCIDVNHLVTTKIMDYLNEQDFYNLISIA